ncbi:MAG: hypothetical protein ABL926_00905 [Novosphingobium sp.]|uniref:hypothetical protein n=1 Tax=Novosphingobium sp. TaxID=1874826 RepID=UPI0032B7FB6F
MSMILRTLAALAAFAALPGIVVAETVEEKNVLAGKVKLDPAMGYIFTQAANRTFGLFLRVPDDATRAEYQKDWDEGFEKAKKKYASAIKTWEKDAAIARQTKAKVPEKPVEPTRENFSIGSIELRDMVSFGPMFIYNKAPTRFTYLTSVKPGTYIYYGPLMYSPGLVPAGQCYCMGTVKFDVKAGVVTDIGNFLVAAPKPAPPYDVTAQFWQDYNAKREAKGKAPVLVTPELAYGVPDSLKGWPSVQAEFHASGKLNNYFGTVITRMPPIPGVLDYRRDTVIDARTGTAVPNPPIRTQVKLKK